MVVIERSRTVIRRGGGGSGMMFTFAWRRRCGGVGGVRTGVLVAGTRYLTRHLASRGTCTRGCGTQQLHTARLQAASQIPSSLSCSAKPQAKNHELWSMGKPRRVGQENGISPTNISFCFSSPLTRSPGPSRGPLEGACRLLPSSLHGDSQDYLRLRKHVIHLLAYSRFTLKGQKPVGSRCIAP